MFGQIWTEQKFHKEYIVSQDHNIKTACAYVWVLAAPFVIINPILGKDCIIQQSSKGHLATGYHASLTNTSAIAPIWYHPSKADPYHWRFG